MSRKASLARVVLARVFTAPCVAACLLCTAAAGVANAEFRVSVDEAQRASLVGRSESLRTVVEALCEAGKIRLLSFDVEDRAIVGNYEDLPVEKLFARILRDESFMLGFGGSRDSGTRVSWLRVIGDPNIDSTAQTASSVSASPGNNVAPPKSSPPAVAAPEPPKDMKNNAWQKILAGFGQEVARAGDSGRQGVLDKFNKQIVSNDRGREVYLGLAPRLVAETVADFDNAGQVIKFLEDASVADSELRSHSRRISQEYWSVVRERSMETRR